MAELDDLTNRLNPQTNEIAVALPYRNESAWLRNVQKPKVLLGELYSDLRRDAEELLELGDTTEYMIDRSDTSFESYLFVLYIATGDDAPHFDWLRDLIDAADRQAYGAEIDVDGILITTKEQVQVEIEPTTATTDFKPLRKSSSWPP